MNENLTPLQRKAIAELQRIFQDEVPEESNDPRWYKRFLIARDYNIKQAEFMIRKHLRWLKEMQIDTMRRDFKVPEVLQKYVSWSLFGLDKEGSPVRYVGIGKMDEIGLFKSINTLSFLKTVIGYIYEEIDVCQERGESFSQTNNIFDLSGLTYSQIFNKEVVQEMITLAMVFQDNYPEYMKRLVIINASATFTTIWPIIKKCIGSNLMQKISVFGGDGWKEELRRIIDPDVLPAFLGGNRRDPDGNPMLLSVINHGGIVDEKYYARFCPEEYRSRPETNTLKINRQSCSNIPIHVTELNSIINWEFFVENRDVGFGLLQKKMDGSIEEHIPIHKRKTENLLDCGMYRCKDPGNYFITFDNTHSWMKEKIVHYRIWISLAN